METVTSKKPQQINGLLLLNIEDKLLNKKKVFYSQYVPQIGEQIDMGYDRAAIDPGFTFGTIARVIEVTWNFEKREVTIGVI